MRVVAIVQARMGSTRLPGKVLAEVDGWPLLVRQLWRLKRCLTLDSIVVATTLKKADHPIVATAQETGVGVFRGSEDDVLGRVLGAAQVFGADVIVEVTGDCPLLDPALVDLVVDRYLYMRRVIRLDMLSTTRDSLPNPYGHYFPRGMDIRVFTLEVLEHLDRLTKDDPVAREHVSVFAWENQHRFHVANLPAPEELCDDVRLTVDTSEDLELVRRIFEHFAPRNDFSLREILGLLADRPKLREINRHILQKVVR